MHAVCAAITALLASTTLKRAQLCNLISLKVLLLEDPEQRLEELDVTGCKMLTSLRVASPALTVLYASSCYRLQVHGELFMHASCCTPCKQHYDACTEGCCSHWMTLSRAVTETAVIPANLLSQCRFCT